METQDWAAHYREVRARITTPVPAARKTEVCARPEPPNEDMRDRAQRKRVSELMYGLPVCPPEIRFSIQQILLAYDMPWLAIIGRGKFASLHPPRRAITWMLHLRGWSTPQIGEFIGRDHTTVVHSLQRTNTHYKPVRKTRGEAFWL